MTWSLTPKLDQDYTDSLPFMEIDYRRRVPHPNYKEHYDCENEVLRKGKKFVGKLKTCVIWTGITYGHEENFLSFLFKRAWMNDEYLPIFGDGWNYVPLIHVEDLAKIVRQFLLMKDSFSKVQHILAVEQTPCTLQFIVKYISRCLGTGKIRYLSLEEAFLYPDIEHCIYDNITANIAMEPEFISSSLKIPWKSNMNFVENIEEIVEEFRLSRNLQPLRILIHGLPCVGKTKLSLSLSEYYKIRYISSKIIKEESSAKLKMFPPSERKSHDVKAKSSNSKIQESIDEESSEFEKEDSEDEIYHKYVQDRYHQLAVESQKLSYDQYSINSCKMEMMMNSSQNQGFVLDGFPESTKQLSELFNADQDPFNSTTDSKLNPKLVPNYVIILDTSDDYLLDKTSRVPEREIQDIQNGEQDLISRLFMYRDQNKNENGVIKFFENENTKIIEIDISDFPDEQNGTKNILEACKKIIGKPRNFPSYSQDIEKRELMKIHRENVRRNEEKLRNDIQKEKSNKELEEKINKIIKKSYFQNIEDERILSFKTENFRKFMVKKIIPTLTRAIMIVTEKQPDEPIDFLAQTLFKINRNGRMYNPKYTRNGEHVID